MKQKRKSSEGEKRKQQLRKLAKKNPWYSYECDKNYLNNHAREVEIKSLIKELRL
jgi:hypothetical protein